MNEPFDKGRTEQRHSGGPFLISQRLQLMDNIFSHYLSVHPSNSVPLWVVVLQPPLLAKSMRVGSSRAPIPRLLQ